MDFLRFRRFCEENGLRIFTTQDLVTLFDDHDSGYVNLKIDRWQKKGLVRRLKKGIYSFADEKLDEFEIASVLITPSYVSLESALSHYSIIPDVGGEVSSVTTKNTRLFNLGRNRYKFHHVKNSLFFGYTTAENGVQMALPEKAILDYFYFKNEYLDRLNEIAIKTLNMKEMTEISKKFPLYVRKLFKILKNDIVK